MKKTIAVAALAALAWARDARADDAQKARQEAAQDVREAKQDAAKQTAEAQKEASEQTREAQQNVAETRQEAGKEVREAKRDAAQEGREGRQAMSGREKRHVFDGQSNFDVDGKVQKVSGRSITIAREELPAVTLQLEKYTEIELDGEKAARTQLKQGQDVKASFNLNGDKAVAVELKAETKE